MLVYPERINFLQELPKNKKLYFASDFHLGIPNKTKSFEREKKIIRWLDYISKDATTIFLVGDLFDFWFEYKTVIPKSFVRFQAKLAQLVEKGIHICLFVGNHDVWIRDYLHKELGVCIFYHPVSIEINNKKLYVGHGDGLGGGDYFSTKINKLMRSSFFRWVFQWIHPDIGIRFAQFWSKRNKIFTGDFDESFQGEKERLWQYCKQINAINHHDFYIFGHRHLPLELPVSENSTYFNLGEWVSQYHYLKFDGEDASLHVFED